MSEIDDDGVAGQPGKRRPDGPEAFTDLKPVGTSQPGNNV